MRSEFFMEGTPERAAWVDGKAVCPECNRYSCRGQCGCSCKGCKSTPLEAWSRDACDVIREMRERSTPEGREAWLKRYRGSIGDAPQVTWGQCVSQVERTGCPHEILTVARKPESRLALEGAKDWWSNRRSTHPTMLLSGMTGRGKTVAAAHVAIKFAEARKWWLGAPSGPSRPALVWLTADLIARKALLDDNDEAVLERAGACEFLVVDEVPATGAKAGLLALGQLIARRIDSGKPMVVTTNADGPTLREPLGAHVVDRFKRAFIVKDDSKRSMR
jgi:hypothetical protein